ncbi:MAG: hypothetical protein KDI36_14150, partial [Pseudomonadales bacterium]|nr:hypothetical protein [Pseudomonadales bacterium]
AATVILSQSAVPVAGQKQLYIDGLGGAATLGRTQPTGTSNVVLAEGGGSETYILSTGTLKEMTLQPGVIDVNMYLSENTNGSTRNTEAQLTIKPNNGNPDLVLTNNVVFSLTGTPTINKITLTNGSAFTMPVGTTIELQITNLHTGSGTRDTILSQVASAPYSEVVLPVTGSIEIISVDFYDGPAAGTPNLITETPPGSAAYIQAVIQDAFGSSDVNTGCTGGAPTNCPTVTITDATAADRTGDLISNEMTFVSENTGSGTRTFEIAFTPTGFGTDGDWTVEVTGNEGTEGLVLDTAIDNILVGLPALTTVKISEGATSFTPNSEIVFRITVENTGTATAKSIVLEDALNNFFTLNLDGYGSGVVFEFDGSGCGSCSIGTDTYSTTSGAPYSYDPFAGSPPYGYDDSIRSWNLEVNGTLPVGEQFILRYKTLLQ